MTKNKNIEKRREITATVERIINDHISVHPLLLQKEDIAELRKVLRASPEYQKVKIDFTAYRWWNSAVRRILDLQSGVGGKPRTHRMIVVGDHKVMDSMKEWAEKHGIMHRTLPEQTL